MSIAQKIVHPVNVEVTVYYVGETMISGHDVCDLLWFCPVFFQNAGDIRVGEQGVYLVVGEGPVLSAESFTCMGEWSVADVMEESRRADEEHVLFRKVQLSGQKRGEMHRPE